MADSKSKAAAGDAGQAEIQHTFDEAQKQGYFGTRPEGAIPNEAYTLQSGPDAPTPLEEHIAFNDQRTKAMKSSPAQEVK